jgi:ketosteroid isomerase-like protein
VSPERNAGLLRADWTIPDRQIETSVVSSRACGILRRISQENVDKTTDFVAAYNRRDFDAAVEHFDPDVEWVLPEHQRADSCAGPRAIRRFWEGLDETFDELSLHPQEVVDAGDRVAVRLLYHGKGRGSGVVIDGELYHQVTTFRDGMMVRIEYFTSWRQALAAAGAESDDSAPASESARPDAADRAPA